VSYYALFQGWLLLSQPPGCFSAPTTFPTKHLLRDLSRRSGLFPSWQRRLAPVTSLVGTTHLGIHGLIGVGNQHLAPSPFSALPPRQLCVGVTPPPTAVPPYISGRTSYLRVRLEFLLYPQVIPQFCNTGEFEPRRGLTRASLCPWIAHPVSGLIDATLHALFRLAFAPAPRLYRRLTYNNSLRR
jgi:hypothetical protein